MASMDRSDEVDEIDLVKGVRTLCEEEQCLRPTLMPIYPDASLAGRRESTGHFALSVHAPTLHGICRIVREKI